MRFNPLTVGFLQAAGLVAYVGLVVQAVHAVETYMKSLEELNPLLMGFTALLMLCLYFQLWSVEQLHLPIPFFKLPMEKRWKQ